MNTTNAIVLTGLLVVGGHWAQDKKLSIRIAVGATFLAVALAALNEASPDVASKFGLLIVVGAVFLYGPAIVKKMGLVK